MRNLALPRKYFGRRDEIIDPPYLLSVPKNSFEHFIQLKKSPYERDNIGLEYILKTSFPFRDPDGNIFMDYLGYEVGDWECNRCGYRPESDFLGGWGVKCPVEGCDGVLIYKEKYTPDECRVKGLTYSAPLRVMFRLRVRTKEGERETPPRKVYFGEIPLMTDWGSFIINGSERVIVNQLIRSTGVFFEEKEEKQKDSTITRIIYRASIIPDKGSRIEFELSGTTDQFSARIDRKKISGIAILRAWGFETAYDILRNFYEGVRRLKVEGNTLVDSESGEVYRPEDLEHHYIFAVLRYRAKLEDTAKEKEFIEERFIEDWEGLEILLKDERIKVESVTILPNENAVKSRFAKIVVDTLREDTRPRDPDKLSAVKVPSEFTFRDYGYMEIYKKLRLVETMTMEIENLIERARSYYDVFFGDITRYDLSRVGRVKINAKVHRIPKTLKPADINRLDEMPPLALAEKVGKFREGERLTEEVLKRIFKEKEEVAVKDYTEEEARFLLPPDLIAILKYLIDLRFRRERKDDIAHLGNRRVRSVGELLENQARNGIAKMEKVFRDRIAVINPEDPNVQPKDLINPRYLTNSILEFLKGGQLSQYLDNTNPLSALTHKRRLSALGPGGLTRESATFEIRDVHPSHYGRICPIETPEGQNIGLVTSMTVYAQVNEYGFLITPYRKVENGVVTDKIEYLAAYEEEDYVIAQSTPTDEKGRITEERVLARHKNDIRIVKPEQVNYIDVSPRQVISVSSALIPFLEHDDANRALMGSNMQRQAVPLIFTQAPLIGTGMEKKVAKDSHSVVVARRGGTVEEVSSNRIVIRVNPEEIDPSDPLDLGIDIYDLKKFQRTNQNTCVNQRPIVQKGQQVKAGDVIADGQSTFRGELALGKDVIVAFMPWRGYNFEDAIVISERLVKEDVYTSIHIEELEVEARETRLGEEDITRQIPGVPEKALAHLDEYGIVRVGTYVKPGDILVGKVTPKGEAQLTPEEKLLQAIFGEKTKDVKDSSLRCPPGVEGVVIDVQIFTRRTGERRSMLVDTVEREELEELQSELEKRKNLIIEGRNRVLKDLILGKKIEKKVTIRRKTYEEGTKIDEAIFNSLVNFITSRPDNFFKNKKLISQIQDIVKKSKTHIEILNKIYDEKKKTLYRRGDLPPGVITLVKVYIAQKRKIKVGDKMAGRHGNKGVISVVLPVEDMPFLPDGTPVDVVLNPLGVPSRMNVGQILETHLGWAARGLGKKIGEMLEKGTTRKSLTKWMKETYAIGDPTGENARFIEEFLNSLSDEEFWNVMKEYAEKGIPMATPAFEGADEDAIKKLLKRAGLPETGKTTLYDGRTGEPFDFEVTVGWMHMLKLVHMVDDKVHARSTGPYSLVTQQPLGGRAQFGGQRLGEMEVWALEAHGAAYTLQEMLTVKSDDIEGRSKVYESIVKGKYTYSPGIPESFRVLVRELKALGLDVRCTNGEDSSCDQVETREEDQV